MRFIHTADWHLGKRLHDFSLHEVQQELIGSFVDLVRDSVPDAVVVAGDVFDTQVPQLGALELWEHAVEAIVGELGVPMFVIPGNHDHADRLSAHRGLAKRAGLHYVRSLADCPKPVTIGGVDLYGVPFHKPVHVNAAYREQALGIGDFDYGVAMGCVLERLERAADSPRPAVLVAHAYVDGAEDEPEGEDAIMVGGAGAVPTSAFDGFAYVALGHIHSARRLGQAGEVHYSGSLFPYSFAEAAVATLGSEPVEGQAGEAGVGLTGGAKGVNVVEVGPNGSVTHEFVSLAPKRRVQVVEGLTFEEVVRRARELPDADRRHYTLVRITDHGPVQNAIAQLRDVLPHAVLEQPNVAVAEAGMQLQGDHRTISPEVALEQFYEHVYGEGMSPLEREVLAEVLSGSADEVAA